MIKLVSDNYTIFINGKAVTMMCNTTNIAHSLSNLGVSDIKYQGMGIDDIENKLKDMLIANDVNQFNALTGSNFAMV